MPPAWLSLGAHAPSGEVRILCGFFATEGEALTAGKAKAREGAIVAAFDFGAGPEVFGASVQLWLTGVVGAPQPVARQIVGGIGREIARAAKEGRIQ